MRSCQASRLIGVVVLPGFICRSAGVSFLRRLRSFVIRFSLFASPPSTALLARPLLAWSRSTSFSEFRGLDCFVWALSNWNFWSLPLDVAETEIGFGGIAPECVLDRCQWPCRCCFPPHRCQIRVALVEYPRHTVHGSANVYLPWRIWTARRMTFEEAWRAPQHILRQRMKGIKSQSVSRQMASDVVYG